MSKLLSVNGVQTNFMTTGKCVRAVVAVSYTHLTLPTNSLV